MAQRKNNYNKKSRILQVKTKICTKCKKRKLAKYFDKCTKFKDGYKYQCKKCRQLYRIKNKEKIARFKKQYYKKFPWKLVLLNIKSRCYNSNNKFYKNYGGRGIKCLITDNELKELWFRDKAYLMKRPSIDRIDNDGDYTYKNCQFIEKSQNSKKDRYVKVAQYDLKDNFIKNWNSIQEITSKLEINQSNISNCINNKIKTSGGFIWKKIIK